MMIFIWILIGFGIYFLLKNRGGTNYKIDHGTDPEETLKQRYINGEIDEEMYTRMLKIIRD